MDPKTKPWLNRRIAKTGQIRYRSTRSLQLHQIQDEHVQIFKETEP